MKILLLAGCHSNEREVSLATGRAIYNSLVRQEHKVFAIDPATSKSLIARDGKFMDSDSPELVKMESNSSPDVRALVNTISSPGFDDIDIVFLALHGGEGENGTIQCLLELSGKKYTGSGMTASAIAMDKAVSKRLMASENIKTPQWAVYHMAHDNIDERMEIDITHKCRLPIIVKPNDGGSTVGLSKVNEESELHPALLKATESTSSILVEEFIEGRELTVAVLDGKPLPIVEIISQNELYDYEAKYTKGKSEYKVPTEIDETIRCDIKKAAVKIYNMIGASGVARVDFILDKNNEFYCLELNTLPGMTDLSLVPMAAREAGIDFDELIARIIKSAESGF